MNNFDNPYNYQPYPTELIPQKSMMMPAPIPKTSFAFGDVANAILQVQKNPDAFSADEIKRARELSMQYFGKDIEFASDIGRIAKNAIFDAVDSLVFGAIPDAWGEKLGAKKLTSADELAGMVGSTAAFFVPGIGPMATGTRIAKAVLPKMTKGLASVNLANKAGEAGSTAVEAAGMAEKGLGTVSKWLESPAAVSRVGSAIGAGFNFEDGINPMGLALGALFPVGGKGAGAIDDATSMASKIDAATSRTSLGLEEALIDAVRKGKTIDVNDMAKAFDIPTDDLMKVYERVVSNLKRINPTNAFGLGKDLVKPYKEVENVTENLVVPLGTPYPAGIKSPPLAVRASTGTSAPQVFTPADLTSQVFTPANKPTNVTYQFAKNPITVTPEQAAVKVTRLSDTILGNMASQIYNATGIPKQEVLKVLKEYKAKYPSSTVEDLFTLFGNKS